MHPWVIVLPLGRSVGVLAKFRCPTPLLNGVVYPGKYHCRPTEEGGVMIGSDEFDIMADEYTDTSKPPSWLYGLRDIAAQDISGLGSLPIEEFRIGLRPLPVRRPPANRPSSRRGGRLCRGHAQRHTLAAIVGRTVAGEVGRGKESGVVGEYRLGRVLPTVFSD